MNNNTFKLNDVRINKENGHYSIKAEYIEDTDTEVIKHTIKVPLHIERPTINIVSCDNACFNELDYIRTTVDFGFGEIDGAVIEAEVIKTKTKEMTLEEIEKELGYQVKIVSADNNMGKMCSDCEYHDFFKNSFPCRICHDDKAEWKPIKGEREMSLEEIEKELGHPVKIVKPFDGVKTCTNCKYMIRFTHEQPCVDCFLKSKWEHRK